MVVPDGTMQKGKRLGAKGVGEGVYGPPRGLALAHWTGGGGIGGSWASWRALGVAAGANGKGALECGAGNGGRSVKSKPNRRYRHRQAVSETGRPCEMRLSTEAER